MLETGHTRTAERVEAVPRRSQDESSHCNGKDSRLKRAERWHRVLSENRILNFEPWGPSLLQHTYRKSTWAAPAFLRGQSCPHQSEREWRKFQNFQLESGRYRTASRSLQDRYHSAEGDEPRIEGMRGFLTFPVRWTSSFPRLLQPHSQTGSRSTVVEGVLADHTACVTAAYKGDDR